MTQWRDPDEEIAEPGVYHDVDDKNVRKSDAEDKRVAAGGRPASAGPMPFSEAIMDQQTWDDAAYTGLDKLSFGALPAFMDWSNRTAGIPESEKPGREQMRRDIAIRSPTASKIGGAVGTIAPLIATGGGSGVVRGALTAGGQNVIDQTSRNILDDRPVDPTEALMSTALGGTGGKIAHGLVSPASAAGTTATNLLSKVVPPGLLSMLPAGLRAPAQVGQAAAKTVGQVEKAVSPLIAGAYGGLEKPNDVLTEEEQEARRRRR